MITRILSAMIFLPLLFSTASADSGNLLINGDFHLPEGCGIDECFEGWSMTNGYWQNKCRIGAAPNAPGCSAEMDRDFDRRIGETFGWPLGEHDWLWQDMEAPGPHTQVVFDITEAHHMTESSFAEVRIYGSPDGQTWDEIWFRGYPDGINKRDVPRGENYWTDLVYVIPASYAFYRLEFHGAMIDPTDGWKITNLSLTVE